MNSLVAKEGCKIRIFSDYSIHKNKYSITDSISHHQKKSLMINSVCTLVKILIFMLIYLNQNLQLLIQILLGHKLSEIF